MSSIEALLTGMCPPPLWAHPPPNVPHHRLPSIRQVWAARARVGHRHPGLLLVPVPRPLPPPPVRQRAPRVRSAAEQPAGPPRLSDAHTTRSSKSIADDPSMESPHQRQGLPKALELFDMHGAARWDSADDFHYVLSVPSLGRETRPSLELEAPKCAEMLQDNMPSSRASISEVLQRAHTPFHFPPLFHPGPGYLVV